MSVKVIRVLLSTIIFLVISACSNTKHNMDNLGAQSQEKPRSKGEYYDRSMGQAMEAETDISVISCPAIPYTSVCTLNKALGTGDMWIYGDVLAGDKVYQNGAVQVDSSGKIVQVGCLKAPQDAAVLSCPTQVISPGLINPHDHLTYNHNSPGGQNNTSGGVSNPDYSACNSAYNAYAMPKCKAYRYERRNEWRKGLNDTAQIVAPRDSSDEEIVWNEMRHVMAGATTAAGSGGYKGMVRNPDVSSLMEGLVTQNNEDVDYDTFPWGDYNDTDGHDYGDCDYPSKPDPSTDLDNLIYLPHVAEGINEYARNELLCLLGQGAGSVNFKSPKSTFIHTVAANPADGEILDYTDMTVVWSPRSNISLYGNTAQVTLYRTLGARVALSSDWTPSGSINLLRELSCANQFNTYYLNNYFSKQELWKMVTVHAARALGIHDQVGTLKEGYWADLAIYNTANKNYTSYYDPMISGSVGDVSLVLRGGRPLYGQSDIVMALDGTCGGFPSQICGQNKAICTSETGFQIDDLYSANKNSYQLYSCDVPDDEPTCVPARYGEYSGTITRDDIDGDGISNSADNCPSIFNPIRPMDNGVQADYNNDGNGDVCDPNPLGR